MAKNEDSQMAIDTDQIRRRLGTDMCVTFEVVDDIPRERSGKYKLIVNNVMLE